MNTSTPTARASAGEAIEQRRRGLRQKRQRRSARESPHARGRERARCAAPARFDENGRPRVAHDDRLAAGARGRCCSKSRRRRPRSRPRPFAGEPPGASHPAAPRARAQHAPLPPASPRGRRRPCRDARRTPSGRRASAAGCGVRSTAAPQREQHARMSRRTGQTSRHAPHSDEAPGSSARPRCRGFPA